MKGKDMVLSDFLLWENNDDNNPNNIIPISFHMYKILEDNINNFNKYNNFGSDKYLIQMHFSGQNKWYKTPRSSWSRKGLNPNLRPEKQHTIPKQGKSERPQIGQGRAGSKRKKPDSINQAINQPSDVSQEIPGGTKIVTGKTNSIYSTKQCKWQIDK